MNREDLLKLQRGCIELAQNIGVFLRYEETGLLTTDRTLKLDNEVTKHEHILVVFRQGQSTSNKPDDFMRRSIADQIEGGGCGLKG